MKDEFRGLGKVFSFTFIRHIKSKGYRNITMIVAILCLVIPIVFMSIMADNRSDDVKENASEMQDTQQITENAPAGEGEYTGVIENAQIRDIFVVDRSTEGFKEISGFKPYADAVIGSEAYSGVSGGFDVTDCGKDLEKAGKAAYGRNDAIVMVIDNSDNDYEVALLIPQDSSLTAESIAWLDVMLRDYIENVKQKWSASGEGGDDAAAEDEGPADFTLMAVTFLNIMIMYFFVLLYGQGVANSVIMEKSSKLMEVFLITVKPSAMILGKLLAITLAGVIQLLSWIVSMVAGIFAGDFIAGIINPEGTDMISALFEIIKACTEGRFTFGGAVIAVLVAVSGILLYCSLAGMGGAMASKQEDLASTNVLFTMILIVSYFAALFGGGIEGFGAEIPWLSECLDWIPFTAVLVLPARLLTGTADAVLGLISLGETALVTLLLIYLSGRIYKATALYRGKIPGFKEIMHMISSK